MAKYTNTLNMPLSLAVFLAHDEYPHNDNPMQISATSLLKPIKQIILAKRIPRGQGRTFDVTTRIASTYGTALHDGIEKAWCSAKLPETLASLGYAKGLIASIRVNPTDQELEDDPDIIAVYTEYRTTRELGEYTISGEFDFLADGRLRDTKSTGVYAYTSGTKVDDYRMQGSIYRWLNPLKVTDDIMAIDHIFTDWSALAAKTQEGYPAFRMQESLYTLMPIDETERWIKNKLDLIAKFMLADEDDIPPCTNKDLWVGPSKFKYYKNPQAQSRATKVYDEMYDAQAHLMRDGSVGIVKEYKDAIKACIHCDALPVCRQAAGYTASGELRL